ncbi:thiol peroxidase [Leptotrichia sp. oral taxon 847]|uniref:thiol peroxidase n=1 Tax=Leptotrichia sp. oral taxon 847 TaxID=1785996 RepID=UPI000767E8FB|nr:thiol peroxidase [Leptotrichia sp. oral taxon 847]AMD95432.1 redoxin [Leptotrichia sp. oral taxon 847]
MKKIILNSLILLAIVSCGNKTKSKTEEVKGVDKKYLEYVASLKSENDLKIKMGGEPVTIVGKKLKVGDKITQIPMVVNTKLEEKNIFDDKNIKVLYTAPSLDTKVCSIQTKILNDEAKKNPDIKFYSITEDTPFAQTRFCTENDINGIKAISDSKYHQFGLQNGLFIKEKGLLTRALIILDKDNTIKYIEYVSDEKKEADIDKALDFLKKMKK